MKKLLILTLTLLLPFAVFAQANKPLTKAQQNLQKRNEQTLQHLQMLGRSYNRINKTEVKEQIAQNIDREIEHWYMENMQTINQAQQEEAMKENKPVEDLNIDKQQLAAEVKAGKIPEIMYKTVSDQVAVQLKQRAEMQNAGKNTTPKQKGTSKQKGKGVNPFKK